MGNPVDTNLLLAQGQKRRFKNIKRREPTVIKFLDKSGTVPTVAISKEFFLKFASEASPQTD